MRDHCGHLHNRGAMEGKNNLILITLRCSLLPSSKAMMRYFMLWRSGSMSSETKRIDYHLITKSISNICFRHFSQCRFWHHVQCHSLCTCFRHPSRSTGSSWPITIGHKWSATKGSAVATTKSRPQVVGPQRSRPRVVGSQRS